MNTIPPSIPPLAAGCGTRPSRGAGLRARWLLVPLLLLAAGPAAGQSTTRTWTGGSTQGADWTAPQNWGAGGGSGGSLASNSALIFNGSTRPTNNNNTAANNDYSITFATTAGAFTLNGNEIDLIAGLAVTNLSDNAQNVNLNGIRLLGDGAFISNGGQLTINSTVSELAATAKTLTLGGSGNVFVSSAITAASASISKTGSGVATLANANTHTGTTTVSAGTLALGHVNALQNSTLDTGSSGTQEVTFTASGANLYNLGGLQGGDALAIGANSLSIGSNNSSTTYSGVISGNGGITKVGDGILTLSGGNDYKGATTVSAGTLLINGDQSDASGTITVASGATLGGSGTIGGDVDFNGGTHSPGNSPGIQTINGTLNYNQPTTVVWELIGNTESGPGINFDQIVVKNNLNFNQATTLDLVFDGSLNNGVSSVNWNDPFWGANNRSWLLYDVGGAISGFDKLTINSISWLDSGGNAFNSTLSGAAFSLSIVGGNQIFLNYTGVPEPTTFGLLSLVLGFLTFGVRGRRRLPLPS